PAPTRPRLPHRRGPATAPPRAHPTPEPTPGPPPTPAPKTPPGHPPVPAPQAWPPNPRRPRTHRPADHPPIPAHPNPPPHPTHPTPPPANHRRPGYRSDGPPVCDTDRGRACSEPTGTDEGPGVSGEGGAANTGGTDSRLAINMATRVNESAIGALPDSKCFRL